MSTKAAEMLHYIMLSLRVNKVNVFVRNLEGGTGTKGSMRRVKTRDNTTPSL